MIANIALPNTQVSAVERQWKRGEREVRNVWSNAERLGRSLVRPTGERRIEYTGHRSGDRVVEPGGVGASW
jgi:hypothetical protein